MTDAGVVVVGGGLAGLACAFELAERDAHVLLFEAGAVVGGRTASWLEDGMPVESGLHRFLGFFSALPDLLQRAGVDLDEMVCWEDEFEVRVPDGGARGILGMSPVHKTLRTIGNLVANNALLSPLDKLSLSWFMAAGMKDYLRRPDDLDGHSVAEYAKSHGVTDRALHNILIPLTAGLFFLPPERFSAGIFFGLLAPGVPRLHQMRLGAYMGGMTEVQCQPIAQAAVAKGADVRTSAEVDGLVVRDGTVAGVSVDGVAVEAGHVVLATNIKAAQDLLRPHFADYPWFQPFLAMPTTPSVTVQLDLDGPCMDVDRTVFGPGTALACFAEQSRTTFRQSPGRLSVILTPPEPYLDMPPDDVLDVVVRDGARLGLDLEGHVTRFRVISHPHDFHSLEPGHLADRPEQDTPVPGLSLAGDYTKQKYMASMEGAVVSGQRAADAALAELGRTRS
ncbi:MAG: FAD-dependent oxidoreductase [Acidimicrobiia bacterium]